MEIVFAIGGVGIIATVALIVWVAKLSERQALEEPTVSTPNGALIYVLTQIVGKT